MPLTKYTGPQLKKLKKDELIIHIIELYKFIDIFDNEKLLIDFKNLKEENEKLQQYNEWGKSATLKWNESLIVIEKLKQEKQELKDEIIRLHESGEK